MRLGLRPGRETEPGSPLGEGGGLQQLPSRPAHLPLPSGPLVAGQGGQQGWVG